MGTVRVFKHYIHPSYMWLAIGEFLILLTSFALASRVHDYDPGTIRAGALALFDPLPIAFALLTMLAMAAMGLYQQHLRESAGGIVWRTLVAFAGSVLVIWSAIQVFPNLFLGRAVLLEAAAISLALVLLARLAFSHVVSREHLKRRVLVYGAGRAANTVIHSMRRGTDRRGFRFAGFVKSDEAEDVVDAADIVDPGDSIAAYAKKHRIDQIVVAVDDRRRGGLPMNELLRCKLSGIAVLDVVSFFEQEAGKIMLEFVTPGWLVFSDGFHLGFFSRIGKRSMDLAASFVLLMATWPVMLLTVFAIWIEDGVGAPIVYRQKRVGLNGRIFEVLKLRSMKVEAELDGKAQWAKKNDSRITRVGKFIRRSRIDELPQIINVLSGDMAFIGPRPERPEFVQRLISEIPHYEARHHVKPGITGWAQLCYPYGSDVKDAAQKLQFDLYYVKNYSLFLDFLILITTVEVVLFGKGAR